MSKMLLFSAILGIVSSVVPQFIFRCMLFRGGQRAPRQVVKSFYLGAVLKFIVFVLLFSLSLSIPGLQAIVFFLAYLLSDLVRWTYYWFSLPRTITK
jgi:F0F1-type ATP synthase assembly protein I